MNIIDDIRRRPQRIIWLSLTWNLTYAAFNGVLAAVYHSYWFLTLAALYAALGLMRLSVVGARRKDLRHMLRKNGVAIALMSVVVAGVTVLTIREQRNPIRNEIVMIALATCTFGMVAWTIRNAIIAHRRRSLRLIALRNISCVGMVFSVLSLERAMLGTFGDASESFSRIMEAASGAGAFIVLIAIGLGMIRRSNRL